MKIPAMLLAITALGAAAEVVAQQPINETIASSATGTVEIVNTAGRVRVVGWDRGEIRVTGTLGRGAERLAVQGDRGHTEIRVILPRNARDVRGTELEVRVPARKNVTIRTVSADVQVDDLTGDLEARSTSGDVQVAGRPTHLTAGSVSGDLTLRVTSSQVRASTTSGDILVAGTARESVAARSVSGDVVVTASTPELTAKSVSGDLDLQGVSRRVTASTVSGEAQIRAARIQHGSFETVSGGLRFEGDLQRDAAFNVQSHSGDVELALPARVAADFQISTFSGDIRNDLTDDEPRRTSTYGPGRELRFSTGSGPLVTVKTFSGTVRLRRR